ncbi:hypothetical protein U8P76_29035 (plasmid) [Rhizobium johnstonii]|nr:hypothetical protein U8P76_29035 [Rhizobium johnstonii]
MFIVAALCATLLGISQCGGVRLGCLSDRGMMKEFEAIICVVIGGRLIDGRVWAPSLAPR